MFGVARSAYRARFRFLAGDERSTFIRWTFAKPDAPYDTRDGVIHPFRDQYTVSRRPTGASGELDSPRRAFVDGFPTLGYPAHPSDASDDDVRGITPYTPGPYFPSECGAIMRVGPGGPMVDGTVRPLGTFRAGPGGFAVDGVVVARYQTVAGPGGALADGQAVAFPRLPVGPGGAVAGGVVIPPQYLTVGPGGAVADGLVVAGARAVAELGGAVAGGVVIPPQYLTVGPGGAVADGLTVAAARTVATIGGAMVDGTVDARLPAQTGPGGCVVDGSVAPEVVDVLTGTMMGWGGLALPAGYLFCDGTAQSRIVFANLLDAIAPRVAGSITSGSATLAGLPAYVIQTIRLQAPVEGPGIPSGTKVVGISGPTAITLSAAATASGPIEARFFPWGNGDGLSTFNVPDASGRVLVGAGLGGVVIDATPTEHVTPPLTERFSGQRGGLEMVTLTVDEMPSHQHAEYAFVAPGTAQGIAQQLNLAVPALAGQLVGSAGGSQPHTNMQPYLVVRIVIKT